MLSKICIFVVWNNKRNLFLNVGTVVNCFQKFVSLLSETTQYHEVNEYIKLWIAFKNLYLCCLKQPLLIGYVNTPSCELLSKICIFVVWNNPYHFGASHCPVVNCFQKFVSLLSETTLSPLHIHLLWVVNCFQKFVSLLSETTVIAACADGVKLWIAFKNLYLCCLKQQAMRCLSCFVSCELLSKICIFVVWNNCFLLYSSAYSVVNCFQKFVSLLSETTGSLSVQSNRVLWIAFKNLYLCCLKQLIHLRLNESRRLWIAFKNLYLCCLKQLSFANWLRLRPLWIAFKNLYLCCLKQLDVCSVHKNRKLQAKLQF